MATLALTRSRRRYHQRRGLSHRPAVQACGLLLVGLRILEPRLALMLAALAGD
jgi:hypothetical protein